MTPAAGGPPDLRLALPATAAWLVAWQGRLLSVPLLVGLSLGAAVAVTGLVWRGRHRPWALVAAATLLCAAAAGLVTAAHGQVRSAEPLRSLAERRAAVRVLAVLTDDPRLAQGRAGRDPLVVVRVRVQRVEAGARTVHLRAPLLVLSSDPAWLALLPSQDVQVSGRLQRAERGDDVAAVLSGRGPPEVLTAPSPVQAVAGHLRAGLRAAVRPLPAAERGLLPGLVVGDTSRLTDDVRRNFRTVGLTHLTAVSGTNVAIVVAAALALATRAGLGLRWRPLLAALALAGFVVLARPSPSVLRAALMGVIGLLALLTGGRRHAVASLSAAVLVLVLLSPGLAASPGFALSVLATAGLLVLAPPWRAGLSRWLPVWLAEAVAVPAAAQAACGPIVVALAGTLGLLSVPANLLAVPAVAPATVLGVLAALLAPVSLPLAQGVAWLAYPPTAWLVLVSRTGATLPLAELPWPDGSAGAALLAALTVAAVPLLRRRAGRRVALAGALGAVSAAATLTALTPSWPPRGWLVTMCDVGQGDALAVRTGPDAALVVDAGPDPEAVDRCLRRLGVRRVPLVVLTHPHADHVAGLPGVLRGRRVGAVEVGPGAEPAEQLARVASSSRTAGVPLRRAVVGQTREAGPVRWSVLGPRSVHRGTRSDPNNDSIVLRVETGGMALLLSGDVEPEAQAELVSSGVVLRADVLKVPHHGSAHQHPAFLAAVAARVGLTSVGAGNTYGHPAATTMRALQARGAALYRTDLHGDVALTTRHGAVVVVPQKGRLTGARSPPAVRGTMGSWQPPLPPR